MEIGLQFLVLVVASLSSSGIWILLALLNDFGPVPSISISWDSLRSILLSLH